MKFLHLGDLHLGKSLADFDLKDDQKYILDQILAIIKKESVDGVLIAGDVYDKSIPSEAATQLLDYFFAELSAAGVRTYVVSGNHDSDERLNYGQSFFASKNVFISAKFNGELLKFTETDEHGELDIYLLPFVKASQVRHYYPDASIENYDDAIRTILEKAEIDGERRNIIVAHQYVTGDVGDPDLGGSENVGTQMVGTVEKISYECFGAFDYVALGHIHSPQRVGRDGVRYAGSPLKYSLSEVNNEKTVPIITFGEKGDMVIELVPLKPLRDLRRIRGTKAELLDKKNITRPEDFVYVTLEEPEIIPDAMGIFQQYYPNTVKIDYDNEHTKEIESVDITALGEDVSFTDLVTDFYRLVFGTDISEEELAYMKKAAAEAGVVDEAD